MRHKIIIMMRRSISPSLKFNLGLISGWFREQFNRFRFWDWEITQYPLRKNSPYNINYIGRKSRRRFIKALLGVQDEKVEIKSTNANRADKTVFISELPVSGSLCVPLLLNSIVPLGRSIDEIMAGFHRQLGRDLKRNHVRYHLKQVFNDNEIELADREMLKPYAKARHGDTASQIELAEVRRMSKIFGSLNFLFLDNEVVGCQLGYGYTREGKRYWTTNRCGYPQWVFADPKKFREVNSINIHLALEWALENGYDYYDIGSSLARPGDGLLEWKRRRGAYLDRIGLHGYAYLRLPVKGAAQFLWDAPLFAVERKSIALHLGLPDGLSDEEILNRYREMGFGGLSKVYLHCIRPPSEHILNTFGSFYANKKTPPILNIIISS